MDLAILRDAHFAIPVLRLAFSVSAQSTWVVAVNGESVVFRDLSCGTQFGAVAKNLDHVLFDTVRLAFLAELFRIHDSGRDVGRRIARSDQRDFGVAASVTRVQI